MYGYITICAVVVGGCVVDKRMCDGLCVGDGTEYKNSSGRWRGTLTRSRAVASGAYGADDVDRGLALALTRALGETLGG